MHFVDRKAAIFCFIEVKKMKKMKKTKTNIRVATWNLGTLNKRDVEIVETLSRRQVDICCVQEHGFKGFHEPNQDHALTGNDCKFNFFCAQAGIMLTGNWAKLLKSSAYLTGSFFSNLSLARQVSSFYQCTHLKWAELALKRNVSMTSCYALLPRSQPLRY